MAPNCDYKIQRREKRQIPDEEPIYKNAPQSWLRRHSAPRVQPLNARIGESWSARSGGSFVEYVRIRRSSIQRKDGLRSELCWICAGLCLVVLLFPEKALERSASATIKSSIAEIKGKQSVPWTETHSGFLVAGIREKDKHSEFPQQEVVDLFAWRHRSLLGMDPSLSFSRIFDVLDPHPLRGVYGS